MVDPEEMQDRRLKVPDVHWILDDIVGIVVGATVRHPLLDAGSCKPHGEATWVMVPAVVVPCEGSLAIDGAPKFTAPDDQGVLQQTALLQVKQ